MPRLSPPYRQTRLCSFTHSVHEIALVAESQMPGLMQLCALLSRYRYLVCVPVLTVIWSHSVTRYLALVQIKCESADTRSYGTLIGICFNAIVETHVQSLSACKTGCQNKYLVNQCRHATLPHHAHEYDIHSI